MPLYQRKSYKQLLGWKSISNGSTAMLIEGARRVGKSTVAKEFGEKEYGSYILVDFTRVNDEFKQTFLDTRMDLDSFFLYLQAAFGTTLEKRNSLIIFDEVQLFPPARELIKHLVADGRYDYLETGSLISLNANVKNILIPSEEESIAMGPMDFEEFLWAMGERPLATFIRNSYESGKGLPDSLHRKAMRLWNEYTLVGGMPQAVAAYEPERDLMAAERAKRLILKLYREDIEKYGGLASKRIKAIFDAIPGQLSKHEKKLTYSQVEENSRSRDFVDAFAWLKEAATVNLCTACTDPSVGLALSEDASVVKCYMADTGLLSSMAFNAAGEHMPEAYRQTLLGNASVNEGMLTENAVAQQLVARQHPLHFYSCSSRTSKEDRMEIDFLIVAPYADAGMKPRVSPIEVKSGKRYTTVSLDKFKTKFDKRVGKRFILHPKQFQAQGDILALPLYMAHLL